MVTKIAIVEDEEAPYNLLASHIQRFAEETGQEFSIERFDKGNAFLLEKDMGFGVVFLDIEMDDVNGIALAQKIQKIAPRTNIIYITGYEKYALESYKTYASGFLVKPIDEDMLKDALDHLRFPVSNITDDMLIRQSQGEAVIGKKIQKYREERGLTRNEFAEMLGCVMPTIQRWESGTRVPDVTMLMHIAKVLGVGIEDLIG